MWFYQHLSWFGKKSHIIKGIKFSTGHAVTANNISDCCLAKTIRVSKLSILIIQYYTQGPIFIVLSRSRNVQKG